MSCDMQSSAGEVTPDMHKGLVDFSGSGTVRPYESEDG